MKKEFVEKATIVEGTGNVMDLHELLPYSIMYQAAHTSNLPEAVHRFRNVFHASVEHC